MASGVPAQEAVLPSRGSTATRLPTAAASTVSHMTACI